MDVLSSRLLVPKSTLAAVDSASAAVSHTLAETLVLQENLDYLATVSNLARMRKGQSDFRHTEGHLCGCAAFEQT